MKLCLVSSLSVLANGISRQPCCVQHQSKWKDCAKSGVVHTDASIHGMTRRMQCVKLNRTDKWLLVNRKGKQHSWKIPNDSCGRDQCVWLHSVSSSEGHFHTRKKYRACAVRTPYNDCTFETYAVVAEYVTTYKTPARRRLNEKRLIHIRNVCTIVANILAISRQFPPNSSYFLMLQEICGNILMCFGPTAMRLLFLLGRNGQ